MAERLEGTVAIVVGAGQTPNGRAAAILFARKGAQVMLVDRNLDFARETGEMIGAEGGEGFALQEADLTRAGDCRALVEACIERFGRIDVLHNNVCIVGGDSGVEAELGKLAGRVAARLALDDEAGPRSCQPGRSRRRCAPFRRAGTRDRRRWIT